MLNNHFAKHNFDSNESAEVKKSIAKSWIAQGIKILAFMVLFVFLFVKVSYALRPHYLDNLHIHAYGMQPRNTIDVVYFGGSSAFTFWAPMEAYGEYGFTSFNFANNAMPAHLEKYCLIEALKRQSPKLLIVDLRPFENPEGESDEGPMYLRMYREATIRNFTDGIRYSLSRFLMIQNVVTKEMRRLNYHFDIAAYHTRVADLTLENQWKYAFNIPDDETKGFGGYYLRTRYKSVEWTYDIDTEEELSFSDKIDPIFLDLVDYCKGLDMEVQFIIPVYHEVEESHKIHNFMRRIIEGQGMRFLDCNEIRDVVGLDVETDFYDDSHAQIFGAKKYTKWLGQYLKEAYDLPDRRGDEKYADWQTAYELWVPAAAENEQAVLELMPEEIQVKMRGNMR